MTTTSIIDQPFQSAAIAPIKRALAVGTNVIALNVQVTNGSPAPAEYRHQIFYAVSSYDVSAAAAPTIFSEQAKQLDLPVAVGAAAVKCRQSEEVLALGGFLYVWSDTPQLSRAVTLKVDLIEI